MAKLIPLLISLTALYACGQTKDEQYNYPLQVGDIYFDAKLDDSSFKLCDETRVFQYYNFGNGLQYKGEKITIIEHFTASYKSSEVADETDFTTIRFIVNCNGQTGRFRVLGMDNNYKQKVFSDSITNQLLKLTKSLNSWIVGEHDQKIYDYYQYLTFKIEGGKLIEIMP